MGNFAPTVAFRVIRTCSLIRLGVDHSRCFVPYRVDGVALGGSGLVGGNAVGVTISKDVRSSRAKGCSLAAIATTSPRALSINRSCMYHMLVVPIPLGVRQASTRKKRFKLSIDLIVSNRRVLIRVPCSRLKRFERKRGCIVKLGVGKARVIPAIGMLR